MNTIADEIIDAEAEKRFPENIPSESKDTAKRQRRNQERFIEGAKWAINALSQNKVSDDAMREFAISETMDALEEYKAIEKQNKVSDVGADSLPSKVNPENNSGWSFDYGTIEKLTAKACEIEEGVQMEDVNAILLVLHEVMQKEDKVSDVGAGVWVKVHFNDYDMILTNETGDTFTIKDTRRNEGLRDFFHVNSIPKEDKPKIHCYANDIAGSCVYPNVFCEKNCKVEPIDKVSDAIELLGWLTENFFQRMPNGFAKRDDDSPKGYQRLYTIHELKELYELNK